MDSTTFEMFCAAEMFLYTEGLHSVSLAEIRMTALAISSGNFFLMQSISLGYIISI